MGIMNICVTGGTGLIARYIIKELSKDHNHQIYAVVFPGRMEFAKTLYEGLSNVEILEADENNIGHQLRDYLPGAIVIHTAFTRKNIGTEISKSQLYAYRLFSVCKKLKAKGVINFSSRSVYKEPLEGELNTEKSPIDTDGLISTAKYGVELLLEGMFEETEISYTSLRCASVNELKTDNNMIRPLNVFVDCVMQGQAITVFNGNQIMSFVDPRDVAQAVMLLCKMTIPWRTVYNVGPDASCTCRLIEMAKRVSAIGKERGYKDTEINIVDKDIKQTAGLDSSLISKDLGYAPAYNLDSMIRSLFEMKEKNHE